MMQPHRVLALAALTLSTAALAACAPLDEQATPEAGAQKQPAATVAVSTTAEAGLPAAPVTVTAEAGLPGAQPTPTRLVLAEGETSVTVNGVLRSGGVASYVLAAEAGQFAIVKVSSGQPPVVLSIRGADGSELLPVSSMAQGWTGALPSSQDYSLDVNAPTEFVSEYTLTVMLGGPQAEEGPAASPGPTP